MSLPTKTMLLGILWRMANAKVPAQLLANQSTSGVDAVSGATKSSNAIKKAFYYAYKSAKK